MSLIENEPRDVSALADRMPVPMNETAAVLSMIERVAKDPTVDIDRVERMMAMHRELRKEEAERAFNAAMVSVQAKLPQVKRDAKNSQTNSHYARLETISAAVDPIIAEHGLSLSFGTETSPIADHYRIVCDVRHGSHKERYFADIPIDALGMKGNATKTATHAFGSTMSYGRRYLKLMIFDISLRNDDNDGNRAPRDREPPREPSLSPEPRTETRPHNDPRITANQVVQLREVLESVGAPEREFLAWLKLKRLDDIPADIFGACIDGAKNYKGANNGR